MFNVNDIKNGMTIVYEGNVYQVIDFQHVKPGKGSAFVKTKLKNLRQMTTIEITFNAGIKLEKANVTKKPASYLYSDGENYIFMDNNSYDQLFINESLLTDNLKFLKEGLVVEIVSFESEIIGINLPEKVSYKIIETEQAVKGNTTSGATKDATIETGLVVRVPLFITEGEEILVSTSDGKYAGRA